MGIAPNIWGPPAWAFLHLMVMSEKEPLDTARLTYYKQLYDLLTHLLPCTKCRNHLLENISKLPALTTIKTKRELFDWTTNLHNLVNSSTQKPTWTLDKSHQHWKDVAEGKKQYNNTLVLSAPNYWKYATFVATLLLLILFVRKCKPFSRY